MAALDYPIYQGDGPTQFRQLIVLNMNSIITKGTLTATDYDLVLPGSISRFRTEMQANFDQLNSDLVTTLPYELVGGDSWETCRIKTIANFSAAYDIVNV